LQFIKVKSHNNNPLNDHANKLAKERTRQQESLETNRQNPSAPSNNVIWNKQLEILERYKKYSTQLLLQPFIPTSIYNKLHG